MGTFYSGTCDWCGRSSSRLEKYCSAKCANEAQPSIERNEREWQQSNAAVSGFFGKLLNLFLQLFTHPVGNSLMVVAGVMNLMERFQGPKPQNDLVTDIGIPIGFLLLFAINYYRYGGFFLRK